MQALLDRALARLQESAKAAVALVVPVAVTFAVDTLTDASTATTGIVSAVLTAAAVWLKSNAPAK